MVEKIVITIRQKEELQNAIFGAVHSYYNHKVPYTLDVCTGSARSVGDFVITLGSRGGWKIDSGSPTSH